jgi:hypothetical protein
MEKADLRLWSEGNGRSAWLLSVALHAAALAGIGFATNPTPQGGVGKMARECGIVLVARQGGEAEYFPHQDSHIVPASFVAADVAPIIPSFEVLPPQQMVPGPLTSPMPLQPIVAATAAPHPAQSSPGRGQETAVETRLFGARGRGSRFVYVFDHSSSMEGAPLAAAKRELIASLQSLQSVHRFQIIFYNEQPHVMPDFRGRPTAMVFADDPGKRLAANFVGSILASGATDHLQALRTALQMRPDVIFLLTDASEPHLRADELRTIQRLNQGTSIQAIEFGLGPAQPRYNFLQQLAAENGGQHVYVDVTRLAR